MAIGYTQLTIIFFESALIKREQINTSTLSYILFMMFCVIPILMLIFPEILYGWQKARKSTNPKVLEYREDHELLVASAALILDFVKKEENLINPDFSITDISYALNLKSQDIQYCFTSILKTKFTSLKKELRVDLAKKELKSGKLISQSMEGVWMKSGFTSKTNFFVSFKEVTGQTPIEYLKSIYPDL